MTQDLIDATQAASARWKAFFNAGDAAGCASCYEETATMVATPFGTFEGREAIQAFWENLIADGFSDVAYVDPTVSAENERSALLTSGWTMNKAQGIITRELWVMQEDGTMKLREDHFEARQ